MKEVKLVQQPDGSFAMQKAHHQSICVCPFSTRVLVPGSVGNLQISAQACNSNCPHFNIGKILLKTVDEDKKHIVELTCSGIFNQFLINNPEVLDQLPANELKIITP